MKKTGDFTKDERQARRLHMVATAEYIALCDALLCTPGGHSREWLHRRLDWMLDRQERLERMARELFPDVRESFVIAKGTLGNLK